MVSSRTAASEQLFGSISDSSSKKLISTRGYKKMLLTSTSVGGERGIEGGKRQMEVDGRVARRKNTHVEPTAVAERRFTNKGQTSGPGPRLPMMRPSIAQYLANTTDALMLIECSSTRGEHVAALHQTGVPSQVVAKEGRRSGYVAIKYVAEGCVRNLRSPRSHIPSRLAQYSWDSTADIDLGIKPIYRASQYAQLPEGAHWEAIACQK